MRTKIITLLILLISTEIIYSQPNFHSKDTTNLNANKYQSALEIANKWLSNKNIPNKNIKAIKVLEDKSIDLAYEITSTAKNFNDSIASYAGAYAAIYAILGDENNTPKNVDKNKKTESIKKLESEMNYYLEKQKYFETQYELAKHKSMQNPEKGRKLKVLTETNSNKPTSNIVYFIFDQNLKNVLKSWNYN